MENALFLVLLVVVLGLIFEYVNGFHDAANAIATVVATRVLTPTQAVIMAGSLNLIGALTGVAVAKTVGSGIVDSKVVTQDLVVAALLAAIIWDLITWWVGLPTSSSHALIFSIIGASVAIHGFGVVIVPGLEKTSFGIVYSPAVAFLVGYLLMLTLYWILRRTSYSLVQRFFGKAQILSSAYMAFSHGGNDGQKTMGVIALALAAYGQDFFGTGIVPTGSAFFIPEWVKYVCAVSIGIGTMTGGWRIMKTMGTRITTLTPVQGFAAETTAGTVIEIATRFGIPISTTHAISGAILGVGSTRRLSAVRWGIAGRIVSAWVLTIPGCFVFGWLFAQVFRIVGIHP
jgi:PiT family inorganic phosphate transporter